MDRGKDKSGEKLIFRGKKRGRQADVALKFAPPAPPSLFGGSPISGRLAQVAGLFRADQVAAGAARHVGLAALFAPFVGSGFNEIVAQILHGVGL